MNLRRTFGTEIWMACRKFVFLVVKLDLRKILLDYLPRLTANLLPRQLESQFSHGGDMVRAVFQC